MSNQQGPHDTTHFGFETVAESDKERRVAGVFTSVASNYDIMNDLMSAGMHRLWKSFTIRIANVRAGERVLDVAAGTGDLCSAFAKQAGPDGLVLQTDINAAMLRTGRNRLIDRGQLLSAVQCNAEGLPFESNQFDMVTVAFGLRNMTHKDQALHEFLRVLKPGGRLLVLEFSKVWKPLEKAYDIYSFKFLPWLGERIAGDADSYRYLAESIRMHPDQDTLKGMLDDVGFVRAEYFNLSAGIVALHRGYKP